MKQLSLPEEASSIFEAVKRLRKRYSGLSFMPDGHLPGHIGVSIADRHFNFKEVLPESTPSCDAIDADGRRVEVKTTGGKAFAFRRLREGNLPPERVIAIKILWGEGQAELIYDGSYEPVGNLIKEKINTRVQAGKSGWPDNGQHKISLKQMCELEGNN